MYEKLPPSGQSLVKIGSALNWTNSVSHDPVTRGGDDVWRAPEPRLLRDLRGSRHPESPECQTFTIFTARETSSSVHTTVTATTTVRRRMLASKIWCQDAAVQNIWPKDSEKIFRMPFPPKVHPFSAHIFCSPGYQRADSYDRNITPGLQLSAKWIWG